MKKFIDYIKESLEESLTITVSIDEDLLQLPFTLVFNTNIFEKYVYQGDDYTIDNSYHAHLRQKERKVKLNTAISIVKAAYTDILQLYREKKLIVSKNKKTTFLACDLRHKKPISVVGMISSNENTDSSSLELVNPVIEILTVFRGDKFAGLKRPDGKTKDKNTGEIYWQYKVFISKDYVDPEAEKIKIIDNTENND